MDTGNTGLLPVAVMFLFVFFFVVHLPQPGSVVLEIQGATFTELPKPDPVTGLRQVKGTRKGWDKEDKCWIDFLQGKFRFDANGNITGERPDEFEKPKSHP